MRNLVPSNSPSPPNPTSNLPSTSSHPQIKPSTSHSTPSTAKIPTHGQDTSTRASTPPSDVELQNNTRRVRTPNPRSSASSRRTAWSWAMEPPCSPMLHDSIIRVGRMRGSAGICLLGRRRFIVCGILRRESKSLYRTVMSRITRPRGDGNSNTMASSVIVRLAQEI